jgi:hypothetical protein
MAIAQTTKISAISRVDMLPSRTSTLPTVVVNLLAL